MNALARLAFLATLLPATLAFPACSKSADAKSKLTLTGSSTVAPLASELAKRFEQLHPEVRIDVQMGGSSRGVADARSGQADIGMASRALKPEENDLQAHPIALDGIAIIVNAKNPITELSEAQIVAIYRGETKNWSGVGGGDAPITVVNKAEGRSTLELFCDHFKVKVADIKADVVIGDNQQGIKTVAGNADAIGYVSIGTAEYEAAHGSAIKLLPLRGIAANLVAVRAGTFPLQRPLNLVTKSTPTGLAKEFIDFAKSAEATAIVEGQFFVPIAPAVR